MGSSGSGVNGEDWGVGVAEVKTGGRGVTEKPPGVGPQWLRRRRRLPVIAAGDWGSRRARSWS